MNATRTSAAIIGALGLALAACGSDAGTATPDDSSTTVDGPPAVESTEAPADTDATTELPTIVVTTNVLGEVVDNVLGNTADVITIMPVDVDPHDFQASAQEIDELMRADAIIVNGGAYEEGLLDVIESAVDEGVPTFEALSAVSTIEYDDSGHDDHDDEHDDEEQDHDDEDHADEDHADEDHADEGHDEEGHADEGQADEGHDDEGHDDPDHSGEDPHFFTDPMRMAAAVDGIVDFLKDTVEFADPDAVDQSAAIYLAQLADLDTEVSEMVSSLPESGRVLVTNHQVFGYFADRYDFDVIGAVIPSGTTLDTTSGGDLTELADLIEANDVSAIFSDTSASDELIQTLADEVGSIDVVALYTESLGAAGSDGGTYVEMVRTNSTRIVDALS